MNEKIYPRALTQSDTDIQPGTTGNGLISVKVATHLLDWGVGSSMTTDEVKKETVSWLADKGNSEQVEFSNKLASVYDAYQKLLGSDAKNLLEQAGCDDAAYLLADGRYMDRINAVYIYDGKDTWTDESGAEWNKVVK